MTIAGTSDNLGPATDAGNAAAPATGKVTGAAGGWFTDLAHASVPWMRSARAGALSAEWHAPTG